MDKNVRVLIIDDDTSVGRVKGLVETILPDADVREMYIRIPHSRDDEKAVIARECARLVRAIKRFNPTLVMCDANLREEVADEKLVTGINLLSEALIQLGTKWLGRAIIYTAYSHLPVGDTIKKAAAKKHLQVWPFEESFFSKELKRL